MATTIEHLPHVPLPALAQAAEYWFAPNRFMRRCATLGDRFVMRMPGAGTLVCLTAPDDLKAVFTADTQELSSARAGRRLAPLPLIFGPASIAQVDGAEHLRMRKLQLPAFHGDRLRACEGAMQAATEDALAQWPLDEQTAVAPHVRRIALDIIVRAVLGMDGERAERVRDATVAFTDTAGGSLFGLQTMVEMLRGGRWDGGYGKVRQRMATLDAIVAEEVADRRSGRRDGDDVLGSFLAIRDDQGNPLAEPEVADGMRTLIIGGHDTTTSTLTWLIERLVRSPEALDLVEQGVAAGDDAPLDAAIAETLRLRPTVPFTPRLATVDLDLNGLAIPADTLVAAHITLAHLRPDVYPDPHTFRPQRFLDTPPGTYTWIPFGGGPRRCIGAAFAQLEMRVIMRTILQARRLVPVTDPDEPIGRRNVTLVAGHGGRATLAPGSDRGPALRRPCGQPSARADQAGAGRL